jgi:aldose 1-epimerase
VTRKPFGNIDLGPVILVSLEGHGLHAEVSNLGATLVSLETPDRAGRLENVVVGFASAEEYWQNRLFLGATAGRCANRIEQGKFTLQGEHYTLAQNDAPHHLHGGLHGFDRVLWAIEDETADAVTLSYVSADGEEGYPGSVHARVRYRLAPAETGGGACLWVEMSASVNRTSVVNLAHHSYFNLGGPQAATILGHELTLAADEFTPEVPIPRGQLRAVSGTPFDFRSPKRVDRDLEAAGGTPPGYDHNFVVRGNAQAMRAVATLHDPVSGRTLELSANQPGVQFYCGKFLPQGLRANGRTLEPFAGLCLETQAFPNAINVPAWQSQVLVQPQRPYRHVMCHRFTSSNG